MPERGLALERWGNHSVPLFVLVSTAAILLGAAAGTLPTQQSAIGLTVLVGAALVFSKPLWGLGVMLLAIPLEPLTAMVGPIEITPIQVIAIAIVATVAASAMAAGKFTLPRTPLDVPILAWIAISFLGAVGAVDQAAAMKKAGMVVVYAIVFYVTASAVKSERHATFLLTSMVLGSAAVAAYGLWAEYQYLVAGVEIPNAITVGSEGLAVPRASGTMTNTSGLAALMVLAVPIALALLSAAEWRIRPFFLAALGVLVAALGFTFTRGAWLGTSVATLVMARDRRIRGPILAMTLIIALLAPGIVSERAVSATQTARPEISARFDYWRGALLMIEQRPLMGVGTNGFPKNFSRLPVHWSSRFAATAHNVYLNVLAENGVIGFIVVFTLIFGVLGLCLSKTPGGSDQTAVIYLLGIGGSIVAFLFHQLTDSLLTGPAIIIPLWTLMGVAVALRSQISKDAAGEGRVEGAAKAS